MNLINYVICSPTPRVQTTLTTQHNHFIYVVDWLVSKSFVDVGQNDVCSISRFDWGIIQKSSSNHLPDRSLVTNYLNVWLRGWILHRFERLSNMNFSLILSGPVLFYWRILIDTLKIEDFKLHVWVVRSAIGYQTVSVSYNPVLTVFLTWELLRKILKWPEVGKRWEGSHWHLIWATWEHVTMLGAGVHEGCGRTKTARNLSLVGRVNQ